MKPTQRQIQLAWLAEVCSLRNVRANFLDWGVMAAALLGSVGLALWLRTLPYEQAQNTRSFIHGTAFAVLMAWGVALKIGWGHSLALLAFGVSLVFAPTLGEWIRLQL